MTGGRLEDGTPFVAIGPEDPEIDEFIVHCKCTKCGEQHYFDLWKTMRGEEITCEHCGHKSRATIRRLDNDTGELEEVDRSVVCR